MVQSLVFVQAREAALSQRSQRALPLLFAKNCGVNRAPKPVRRPEQKERPLPNLAQKWMTHACRAVGRLAPIGYPPAPHSQNGQGANLRARYRPRVEKCRDWPLRPAAAL